MCGWSSRRQFGRMRPVQGLIGSTDTSARRLGRRDRETFDARRCSCRIQGHSSSVVDGSIPTKDHIDRRRVYKFSGHGIDDGAQGNHRGAFGLLARTLPDIAAQFTCRVNLCLEVGGGRLRMAGKALESFPAAWYPLSTYPWDRGAKSSTASEQVASWLSGYPCGVQHDRRLHGCSAELGHGYRPTLCFTAHWEQLLITLRRSRGATGRYQGPTGAPSTAPRRSRRRRTVPTPFPGGGKGLIDDSIRD